MNGLNVSENKTVGPKNSVLLMSQHSRATLLICASAVGVVLGGFALWWLHRDPPRSSYQPVIELLRADKLPIDRLGHADLSKNFAGLTPRDEIMFTRRDDGSFVVLFPTKYGEGSEISGLLYTSRPLMESDTFHRTNAIHFSDRLIAVGGFGGLRIDDRIDENWYHASYRIR